MVDSYYLTIMVMIITITITIILLLLHEKQHFQTNLPETFAERIAEPLRAGGGGQRGEERNVAIFVAFFHWLHQC